MNIGYNLMVLEYMIRDRFHKPGGVLKQFGIAPGLTVVDYGCGPGRYIEAAASLVGEAGLIYAADISETGIRCVKKRIVKNGLKNVTPVLLEPSNITIPDGCADVVYALDMFHRVDDPAQFLKDIRRIGICFTLKTDISPGR